MLLKILILLRVAMTQDLPEIFERIGERMSNSIYMDSRKTKHPKESTIIFSDTGMNKSESPLMVMSITN